MATLEIDRPDVLPQHLRAHALANKIRTRRAVLRRAIGDGTDSAARILLDPPPYARTMTVADLLSAQHRWGAARVTAFCERLGLPQTKAVGALTDRQRGVLALALAQCRPLRPCKPASTSAVAPQQRLDALHRANVVRSERAQLKRDLKAGRASIVALLLRPPDFVATAKVCDMLLAVPKLGRVKVNRVLAQCRVAPSVTVGGLSERQRDELVRLLRR